MAELIQPDLADLSRQVADLQGKVMAIEKSATWWRLFSATALPIIIAVFIAAWLQNGRFDEQSKRIDSLDTRLTRVEQKVDNIEARLIRVEQRLESLEDSVGEMRKDTKELLRRSQSHR